ncbi:hypothetical protein X805_37920 [Sphaerotilus natans subsp. natans DSM 6575]|uniref:Uncharacterized protein n=1 Tax=Sphaerotilus natans subsp. natans DSM 6575 TaxID=1286631 RepID=A0A059KHB5_9BURK|nr:hypothetical protein [Sphaerotilus natans]KDB50584.1 hypothetical protein X805_37920 [Sphaerotilus natans subsp. natans DSM 6575]SIR53073.1 hypothetical protein SAMN05421778_111140 [Sphaerotilus natans]
MRISDLSAEFIQTRGASGLMLSDAGALDCAVRATRQFCAYGELSLSPGISLVEIDGATEITNDEWSIIRPLFELYCEKDNAMLISAAGAGGIESFGRSVAEVEGGIAEYLERLPAMAFSADIVIIE